MNRPPAFPLPFMAKGGRSMALMYTTEGPSVFMTLRNELESEWASPCSAGDDASDFVNSMSEAMDGATRARPVMADIAIAVHGRKTVFDRGRSSFKMLTPHRGILLETLGNQRTITAPSSSWG